jgi:hypothetical protein
MASPLSRAQQPMDHVFLRGSMPPKSRRPLPSTKRIDLNRFYAHRRTPSKMVFLKLMPSCSKKCQTAKWLTLMPRLASSGLSVFLCETG